MTSLPTFDCPKQHIGWAWEAINELDAAFRDFFQSNPYETVVEIDPQTGYHVHKFKIIKPLPSTLERKATEALNNTRHAFDQAVYAACTTIKKFPRKPSHTYFPWRTSPTDLEATFNKDAFPTELRNIIRREEPYPTNQSHTGGNDIIREVAKLANGKHTVGLRIIPSVTSYIGPTVNTGMAQHISFPAPRWDAVKNEMILLVTSPGAKVKNDYKIHFQVVLNESPPLGDIPAIALLKMFASRAENFVKAIEAECAALVT